MFCLPALCRKVDFQFIEQWSNRSGSYFFLRNLIVLVHLSWFWYWSELCGQPQNVWQLILLAGGQVFLFSTENIKIPYFPSRVLKNQTEEIHVWCFMIVLVPKQNKNKLRARNSSQSFTKVKQQQHQHEKEEMTTKRKMKTKSNKLIFYSPKFSRNKNIRIFEPHRLLSFYDFFFVNMRGYIPTVSRTGILGDSLEPPREKVEWGDFCC